MTNENKVNLSPIPNCRNHNKILINDKVGCEDCVQTDKVQEAKEELKKYLMPGARRYDDEAWINYDDFDIIKEKIDNLINALDSKKQDDLSGKEDRDRNKRIDELVKSGKVFFPKEPEWLSTDLGTIDDDMTWYTAYSMDKDGNIKIIGQEFKEPAKDMSVPTKSIWKPISELPKYPLDYEQDVIIKHISHYAVIASDCIDRDFDENFHPDAKYCYLRDFVDQVQDNADRLDKLETKLNK
tara:strand:+ start:47 stop:766 length:720 start_codon:yes stop_codon:yes gene_type:complete